MGTDTFGRDIASRVIYAIQLDLRVIFLITYVPLVIGILIGAFAGYYGRWLDSLAMRLVDVAISLPFLVLVLAIVAIVGAGLTGIYIGVLMVGWAVCLPLRGARCSSCASRTSCSRPAGSATRPGGSSSGMRCRICSGRTSSSRRPTSSSTSSWPAFYLGLGVQAPTSELGSMVAEGQNVLLQAWWVATLSGLVIVVLGASFSMIGDGLADRLGRQYRLTIWLRVHRCWQSRGSTSGFRRCPGSRWSSVMSA